MDEPRVTEMRLVVTASDYEEATAKTAATPWPPLTHMVSSRYRPPQRRTPR